MYEFGENRTDSSASTPNKPSSRVLDNAREVALASFRIAEKDSTAVDREEYVELLSRSAQAYFEALKK